MGSPEKKPTLYTERCLDERTLFQDELATLNPKALVYVDESGVEEHLYRPFARAPRGTSVLGEIAGSRARRISIIAALADSHLKAPMRFDGYCDTEVFNTWVEQALLPELMPGQIVIMDNASFHKSTKTQELIASKGYTVKYLPTYSPDLNPIEHQWAILKARIRKHARPGQALQRVIDQTLQMY